MSGRSAVTTNTTSAPVTQTEETPLTPIQIKLLSSPLVAWVSLFAGDDSSPGGDVGEGRGVSIVSYRDLYQGTFLRDVIKQIIRIGCLYYIITEYNRNVDDNIITRGAKLDDTMERLTNWNIIMKSIKIFYRDELQQVVTVKLPDILRLTRDPEDESSCADIRTTLLLILGCAVQCERKEFFISQILQNLNSEQQHAIKDCITEITDTEAVEHVVSLETQVESLGITGKALYYHLNRVLEERDMYIEEAARAVVDSELYLAELDELRGQTVTTPTSPEKHHIVVELAEEKAKVRRLRMEIEKEREERTDLTEDLKAECGELKGIVHKLREENKSLTGDARSARSYRDELDIVKEKAGKVDKLERQLQSYKDKMHELDFYKARVDELREDNKILIETKVMLEDQLTTSQARVDTIIELENELMNKRKEAEEWNTQREQDLHMIQEMQECITKLQCEKNSTLNESANLEEELAQIRGLTMSDLSQSLRDQLSDTTNTEVLRLELENQRLQKLLAEQREQAIVENSAHILELEKENKRLASKVQKLQESTTKSSQDFMQFENEKSEYSRQVTELRNTIDTVKENSERQVLELERENEQLADTIEALRQRNEENIDLRVKDVERENKRMSETVKEVNQQLSKLDYDYRNLQKQHTRLQEQVEKVEQAEELNEKLDRDNSELSKQVATLQLTVEKYEEVEQELSDKEVENKKLQKQVDNLKEKFELSQQANQDNITLTVENQRLSKALNTSQKAVSRVAELESELEDKEKELGHMKHGMQQFDGDRAKLQELEVKLYTAESEIHKLNKSIELYNKKLEAKHAEYDELQAENKELEATIQSLRLKIRELERLAEDNKTLEESNNLLNQEKDNKDKEIKKLKQTLELKESTIDEYSEKIGTMERDHKSLRRSGEKWRQASIRVREHEKEASDLHQKGQVNKKTITTLREELVQEKIKSQQITNELDQLKSELHKMGLDKEKLESDATAADEHRLQVLQSMMEQAHTDSLSIKDDKIRTLQLHLDEKENLNATLHRQLDTMQKEYQSYLDKRQNEPVSNTTTINVTPSPGKPSSSISQLVIKKTPQQNAPVQQIESGHYLAVQHELIKAQKQLATLRSENAGLKSHSTYSEERAKKIEGQFAAVKGEKNSLQTQNAQLQVENTTLQSQSNTLLKQNSQLQKQMAKLQSDFEETAISHQELNETYECLVADHEQLQQLNDQLSTEYEALISEHGMLKSQHKQLKEEMHEVTRRKENLAREKAAIEEMRQSIHKERLSIQLDDNFSFNQDIKRMNEEKQIVQQQADKMRGEYRDLLSEYKNVKTEYNQLKLKHTELKGDMADCRDQLNKLDIQNAKLTNKCEALERLNAKLEEENKQLIYQLQALLQQNQELLSQTLESSEHFREEENSYRDQLANLRRAKEKLEEKIMDQYKNYERSSKKKGLGAVLVKKAKGFMTKRSRELGRRQTIAGINYLDGDCQTVTAEAPAATSHSVIYTNTSAGKSQTLPAQEDQEDGLPLPNQFRPVSAAPVTSHATVSAGPILTNYQAMRTDGKLTSSGSRKDLTHSQIDLVYGGGGGGGSAAGDRYSAEGGSMEDNKSLSGVSIGSKGSSRGSEETAASQEISVSKSNKVRLRRSRMKAQSIENLFDSSSVSSSAGPPQPGDPTSSAFYTPRDNPSSSIRPNNSSASARHLGSQLYNTTVNHQLTTDHRKIAVSTTALNLPVSVGPLRDVNITIPIEKLDHSKGARSTDDLLSSQNPSNNSSPQISSRSDKYGSSADRLGGSSDVPYRSASQKHDQKRKARHKALQRVSDERQHIPRIPKWSTSMSTEDSDDDMRSVSNRSSEDLLPTKDFDENLPTKDTGPFRNNDSFKSNHSAAGGSMFYTPPSAMRRSQTTSNIPPNSTDQDTNPVVEQYLQSMNDQHSNAPPRPRGLQKRSATVADFKSQSEYAQRMVRGEYVASPKPDLVMGTDNSPRGLVYYDQEPSRGVSSAAPGNHSTSTPKYPLPHEHPSQGLSSSRSQSSNMYASLDSRLNSYGGQPTPTPNDFRRSAERSIPDQNHQRPMPKSGSQPANLSNGLYTATPYNPPNVSAPPAAQQNSNQSAKPEDNSRWYEYGCV